MASFGGSPKTPEVKSIGQLQGEAVNANIASMPAIIQAMKTYGPEYASALLKANFASNPTLKPLADLISSRLDMSQGGVIPEALRTQFTNNLRGAMASRGFADSPVSAVTEAGALGELSETFANDTMTQANNFGRIPGVSVSGDDMGLKLPSIGDLTATAQEQNVNEINDARYKNTEKQSRMMALGSLVGTGVGLASSGGNLDTGRMGGEIGRSATSTFF